MAQYKNFYETLKEAQMRLKNTVVLYDGEPYVVLCITNHKPDMIFRVYLDPVRDITKMNFGQQGIQRPPYDKELPESPQLGVRMDNWMEANPHSGVLRKRIDSAKFNKFRPFPLGMVNQGGNTNFVLRHPARRVEQGLVKHMLIDRPIGNMNFGIRQFRTDPFSDSFRACVKGEYPDPFECVDKMLDPNIGNNSVGFHRNFALYKGPLDVLFLSYKDTLVGFLPDNSFKSLRLSNSYLHTKEAVQDLNLFDQIIT